MGGLQYELARFVLLDWEPCGSMGSHALSAKSVFHHVSLVPPTYPSLNLSLPSLFTPFPVLLFPRSTVSLPQCRREESKPAFSGVRLRGPIQDRALRADRNAAAAAATASSQGSTCSHGPTQRRAVPPVGHGASQRAEEMLGQCTEVCYYSNHCSNHGNAMEDWSGLHCHCHRVCPPPTLTL